MIKYDVMLANVNNSSGILENCRSLLKPSRLCASASIILCSQILVLSNDLGAFRALPAPHPPRHPLYPLMCLFA